VCLFTRVQQWFLLAVDSYLKTAGDRVGQCFFTSVLPNPRGSVTVSQPQVFGRGPLKYKLADVLDIVVHHELCQNPCCEVSSLQRPTQWNGLGIWSPSLPLQCSAVIMWEGSESCFCLAWRISTVFAYSCMQSTSKSHSQDIIPRIFIQLYANISISEKSPLWKVFSSHIPVHYWIW